MLLDDYITPQTAVIIATVLVIIASALLFFSKPKQTTSFDDLINSKETWTTSANEEAKAELKPEQSEAKSSDDPTKLKNVFDVKQPAPFVNPKGEQKSDEEKPKPFKSSYYYAHNQLKKTGGYSDGLKAEDYQMNGPKLLSKDVAIERTAEVATSAQAATKLGKGNSIPINRYLWDDDGNESGVAKIYIDTLPGKNSSSSTSSWVDVNISKTDVVSKLVGVWNNGLIVQIRRKEQGQEDIRYHLYVPRMHGEVEQVTVVVKAKKLIVKLMKKKNTENLKAWPILPSKVVKSSSMDGVDYVNEDLFLQES